MSVNATFFNELKSFVNDHKSICVLTLGLAIVGFSLKKLAGKVVTWIYRCSGITEKTHSKAQESFNRHASSINANRTSLRQAYPNISSIRAKDQISEPKSDIENLPNEILIQIADYIVHSSDNKDFTNFSLVSTSFRNIAYDSQVLASFIEKNIQKFSFEDLIKIAKSNGNTLKKLNLQYILLDDKKFMAICQAYPNLEILKLSNCLKISTRGFKALPSTLRVLDMSYCNPYPSKISIYECITDEKLHAICQACPNLHTLMLDNQYIELTAKGFKALPQSLRYLRLSHCPVKDSELEAICQTCPSLEFLGLAGTEITAKKVEKFPKSLITISLGYWVTDEGLSHVLQACPNLKDLWLAECKNITDKGFQNASRTLYSLNLFGCEQFTDEQLTTIFQFCSGLQFLDLSFCKNIKGTCFRALPKSLQGLKLDSCSQLTDEGVKAIWQACPSLKEIDLSNCFQITNKALEDLPESLQLLNLSDWNQIIDESF